MSDIIRLGGGTNAVIVQLPDRKNPGVVIQYDGIENLLNLVRHTQQEVARNDLHEATETLNEIDQIILMYAAAFKAIDKIDLN